MLYFIFQLNYELDNKLNPFESAKNCTNRIKNTFLTVY